MPTLKQKKLRAERETAKHRRLHGQKARLPKLPWEPPTVEEVTNSPSMGDLVDEAVPKRSKCPECGFSHKVRKDGTMSRHDIYYGDQATQCEGTGQPWNAAASRA